MVVKLATTLSAALEQIRVLRNIESGLVNISASYQPLVAELVMLRLFSILEQSISEVASKLACGAFYANGTAPVLLAPAAKSLAAARVLFSSFGRTKPRNPNWSKAAFITETVEKTIDSAEPFVRHVRNHGVVINEIRVMRNYSAHRNAAAREQYRDLIRRKLGSPLRLSVGQLLLTQRQNPVLMRRYLVSVGVALTDICSGV